LGTRPLLWPSFLGLFLGTSLYDHYFGVSELSVVSFLWSHFELFLTFSDVRDLSDVCDLDLDVLQFVCL
jgi:hypothetical protein